MKKISFIIPCYGSEKTIAEVVAEIKETIRTREGYDYEIVLVADASPDNVYEVIHKLALEDKKIKGINLAKNFGQHSALMTGFNIATGDIMVILDDDGQTPADQVFDLVDKMNEGFDVVYANYPQLKKTFFRNFGTVVNNLMAELLISKPKDIMMTSYFCMNRVIVDEVIKYTNAYPYVGGLVLRSTNNIGKVMVNHRDRFNGTSGYTFKSLLGLWLNGFTAFSVKPLRLASLLGGLVSMFGIFYGIYTIGARLLNPDMPIGYASLISVTVFIGGMNMIMLGLVGEYIGRMYISMNNSPQYVIKKVISSDGK